jgi:hypothetical protein
MDDRVRLSFSFPDETKETLEKMAKDYRMKLMGYIKFIIKKELVRLKEG